MYRIEAAITVSTSGGNQSPPGAKPYADAIKCEGVGHREGRHDRHQRVEPPERNDQTEEEQQVIDAIQDVEETGLHEPKGRLMPPRVEPDQSRVTDKLERSHDAVRWHEAENHLDPGREPL